MFADSVYDGERSKRPRVMQDSALSIDLFDLQRSNTSTTIQLSKPSIPKQVIISSDSYYVINDWQSEMLHVSDRIRFRSDNNHVNLKKALDDIKKIPHYYKFNCKELSRLTDGSHQSDDYLRWLSDTYRAATQYSFSQTIEGLPWTISKNIFLDWSNALNGLISDWPSFGPGSQFAISWPLFGQFKLVCSIRNDSSIQVLITGVVRTLSELSSRLQEQGLRSIPFKQNCLNEKIKEVPGCQSCTLVNAAGIMVEPDPNGEGISSSGNYVVHVLHNILRQFVLVWTRKSSKPDPTSPLYVPSQKTCPVQALSESSSSQQFLLPTLVANFPFGLSVKHAITFDLTLSNYITMIAPSNSIVLPATMFKIIIQTLGIFRFHSRSPIQCESANTNDCSSIVLSDTIDEEGELIIEFSLEEKIVIQKCGDSLKLLWLVDFSS